MFCSQCGNNVGESSRFCEKCGASVKGNGGEASSSHGNFSNNANTAQDQVKKIGISLIDIHKNLLTNYVNFNGRARRKEFWHTSLTICGVMIVLAVISMIMLGVAIAGESEMLMILGTIPLLAVGIYSLAVCLPLLALEVRRLHDTGKSGWFLLLGLIPYIGSVVIFVFTLLDSQPGENQYGPNPKMDS